MVAILAVGIYGLTREREPRYQGKSLSAWLREMARKGDSEREIAPVKAAVRQMGAEAVPSLLKMLRRKNNSPFAPKIIELCQRFDWLRPILAPKMAEEENSLARTGFDLLGPAASNAAPELIKIYHENISESSQLCALTSLFGVAPARGQLLLIEAATNRYDSVRGTALWLTSRDRPDFAVPLLIKGLSDPTPRVQGMAALKLGEFGTNALPAVPALVRLVSVPSTAGNNELLLAAGITLCLVDPPTAARALTNAACSYDECMNQLGISTKRSDVETNGTPIKRRSGAGRN